MAGLEDLQAAELAMRRLLDEQGLAQPDTVEYGWEEVLLRWEEKKLVVAIDVSDAPGSSAEQTASHSGNPEWPLTHRRI